jgi:RNA polymerase sigma factor (sigma-70 family)
MVKPNAHAVRRLIAYDADDVPEDSPRRVTELAGFEAVFMANRPALARFLRARLGGEGDCDDLLQDLWLKLAACDVGPVAEPLAYLFRMAENLAWDRRRSAIRRSNREREWTKGQIDETFGTAIDGQPSAERVLIAREHLRRVEGTLNSLPERTAYAFRAVRIDGTPQKQVAIEIGVSISAVEKHLQKAYRAVLDLHRSVDAENAAPHRLQSEGIHDGGE